MDPLTDYPAVVRQVVERLAGWLQRIPKPGVETILFADTVRHLFQVKRIGWHNGERVNNTVTLVRVKDGKVWVEEDWTDLPIPDELVRAGIPREDIVLAFHPPDRRHLTEFAVA